MIQELFKELYEATIQQIELAKKLSVEYGMLNKSEYLDFQTKLNELSLDDY